MVTLGTPILRSSYCEQVTDAALKDELYADEDNLHQFFVEGAPAMLTENIRSTRKLVNGSRVILDSLIFEDDVVPSTLDEAYAAGVYCEVELNKPPRAVNVRVGGTKDTPVLWHESPLEDLSELVDSVVPGAQVIPLVASNVLGDQVSLDGQVAAQNGIPDKVNIRNHFHFMLSFALTDFKVQGMVRAHASPRACKCLSSALTASAFVSDTWEAYHQRVQAVAGAVHELVRTVRSDIAMPHARLAPPAQKRRVRAQSHPKPPPRRVPCRVGGRVRSRWVLERRAGGAGARAHSTGS